MRVTDRMIFANALRSTLGARARADEAARVASSGVRVEHPGDAPASMAAIVADRAAEARFAAIGAATERAAATLDQVDAALDSVSTMVRRAEQLAIQLANGTASVNDRAAAAAEVEALIEGIAAALNGSHGGRFLFGGTQVGVAPFGTDGSFHGDAGPRLVEVAPGVFEDVAPDPAAIVGATPGENLFVNLRALADALIADDADAVRATIDPIGAHLDRLATERARLGGAAGVLATAQAAARAGRDAARAGVARLTEADVVEAATELALSQRALEAALAAASESFRLTLLDRL